MRLTGNRVIWLAATVSVLVHVVMMAYVREKVMTSSLGSEFGRRRRVPMRVVPPKPGERPVSLAELFDIRPLREAPPAKSAEPPRILASETSQVDVRVREPELSVPELREEQAPVAPLDAPALELEAEAPPVLPAISPETPAVVDVALTAALPVVDLAEPQAPASLNAAELIVRPPDSAPERLPASAVPEFVPAAEVHAKVDPQAVEAEKAAVRALIDSGSAAELMPLVTTRLSTCAAADGVYFRVEIAPTAALRPVPKDMVVIIDASGSIGKDRMSSIRPAANRLLRSATNSDDRFNLVAFRDRYSYAFRSWQPCTQAGYDRAWRWLCNLAAQGRTDVFATIESVLRLPRDPTRPLVALVVTDGDANSGVSDTEAIISKFTELNDGLVSVYMYGVKAATNRRLVERLTRANRGESFVFEGSPWNAGEGLERLSERFRDPVLSDLRIVFAADAPAVAYPRRLRNLCRGSAVTVTGRLPKGATDVAFSLKGLNGADAYESYFRLPLAAATVDATLPAAWRDERSLDTSIRKGNEK